MVSYHPQYVNGSQSVKRSEIAWSPAGDTQEVLLVLASATTHLHKGIYPGTSSTCSASSISSSTQRSPILLSVVRVLTEANSSSKSLVRAYSVYAAVQKAALYTAYVEEASLARVVHAHAWTSLTLNYRHIWRCALESGVDVWRNIQWAEDRQRLLSYMLGAKGAHSRTTVGNEVGLAASKAGSKLSAAMPSKLCAKLGSDRERWKGR